MFIDLISKNELKKHELFFLEKIYFNICLACERNLQITFGKNISNLYPCDIKRILFETKAESSSERIFKNVLMESINSSEHLYPGSGLYLILYYYFAYKFSNKNIDLRNISLFSRKANLTQLKKYIFNNLGNSFSSEILYKILSLGGFSSSVNVEYSPSWASTISVQSGFKFSAELDERFSISNNIIEKKINNPDIIIIDGIIDSVSEIHHLLSHYSENKKKLILITRGYSEDAISTLNFNFKRKTLNCYPIVVPSGIYTINSFKDIAICGNADIVSSLKGDLISGIELEKIKSIESIFVLKSSIIINNEEHGGIKIHVKNLRKKLQKENNLEKRKLLEKRILSLNSENLNFSIGKSHGELKGLIKDRIIYGLGIVDSICVGGITNIKNVKLNNCDSIDAMVKFLISKNIEIVPSISFIMGIKLGNSLREKLENCGGFISENK